MTSFLVELPRFELRITEPKSAVLPLHHSSIVARKRHKSNAKKSIVKILRQLYLQIFHTPINFRPTTSPKSIGILVAI